MAGGVPVTALCVLERRKGKDKPVIKKALVELDEKPYLEFAKRREKLALLDCYRIPGPQQFETGPNAKVDMAAEIPFMLALELGGSASYLDEMIVNSKETAMKIDWPQAGGTFSYFGKRPRSALQKARAGDAYDVPSVLSGEVDAVHFVAESNRTHSGIAYAAAERFPKTFGKPLLTLQKESKWNKVLDQVIGAASSSAGGAAAQLQVSKGDKVGVLLCGRQAPGGHDAIVGLYEYIKRASKGGAKLLGFVGGTEGFYAKQTVELDDAVIASYRHTGGFEVLGRSRDKFDKYELIEKNCRELGLRGLVVVGGTISCTYASYAAEHLAQKGSATTVVAIPSSMGGSFSNQFLEASLGFDTNAKATARLVGNTAIDGSSARKYYYFLRTMEDVNFSSHVTLETALQTKPNFIVTGEELSEQRKTLTQLVGELCDMVLRRGQNKKNFGTVLVPDGLGEKVFELRSLVQELDAAAGDKSKLSAWNKALFESLPEFFSARMMEYVKKEGKVNLTQLEIERLLAEMVKQRLKKEHGVTNFSYVCQYLGYQSRCSVPSVFDSNYGYALGCTAARLALGAVGSQSGYLAIVSNLKEAAVDWVCGAVPLTALLGFADSGMEGGDANHNLQATAAAPASPRSGRTTTELKILPVKVDLKSKVYREWLAIRERCQMEELYENPGPIQFGGSTRDSITQHLRLNDNYIMKYRDLKRLTSEIESMLEPGCDFKKVKIAHTSLNSLVDILNVS